MKTNNNQNELKAQNDDHKAAVAKVKQDSYNRQADKKKLLKEQLKALSN